MSIPNPNPNIADGIKSDNKTLSSNMIYDLIDSPIIFKDVEALSAKSLSSNTEQQITSSAAIPEVEGYTAKTICNIKIAGAHAGKVVTYAYIDGTSIKLNVYNASSSVTATLTVTVTIIYTKN